MKTTRLETVGRNQVFRALGVALALLALANTAHAAFKASLEGQDFISTNWVGGPLNGWTELSYVPCRVKLTGGPASNQTQLITFDHLVGGQPAISDLYTFSPSANCVILSNVASRPPGAASWSYNIFYHVTNAAEGEIQYRALISAGAARNGANMAMQGAGGAGNLQIAKLTSISGTTDVSIVKSGPTNANPGQVINYALTYRAAVGDASGVAVVDAMPTNLTISAFSGTPLVSGNTITWLIGNLKSGKGGRLTVSGTLSASATPGSSFQNLSDINAAQNDSNSANNNSNFTTFVTGVCVPPTIAGQPLDTTNCPGSSVTFDVIANGSATLRYQWRTNGVSIANATNATYTIASVATSDAGNYSVVISNSCGSITSSNAALVVSTAVSAISGSTNVCPNTSGLVYSNAGTALSPTFSWSITGNASIVGSASNVTVSITSGASGSFTLDGTIVDGVTGCSSNFSQLVTILATPAITGQPTAQTVCANTAAGYTVTATGSGLSYQWRKNGVNLSNGGSITGATTASLSVTPTGAGDTVAAGVGYDCVVSGTCTPAATSTRVALTVNTAPSITGQPAGQTTVVNSLASFSVTATGTGLSYQWRRNGVNLSNGGSIAGATTASLSVTPTAVSDTVIAANGYDCVVSGTCSPAATSSRVALTVNKADPNVTTWPTASAITYGQTLAASTLSGGVATPAGSFAFTTPSTAPNAGTASQSVTFTPTDTANYNSVVGSASVTVNKADSNVTTWPTASDITYGQTLADSILSGGAATPAGSFAFTTPSTAPNAGTASQSVTFTPTDSDNYNTVVGSVSVTVNKANSIVTTWPTASAICNGQTLADSVLSGGAATPAGSFAFTTPATVPDIGTASQSVTFTPTDAGNYNTAVGSVSVTVLPGQLAVLPALLDFGSVATGSTVQASFTLTNESCGILSGIVVVVDGGPFEVVTNSIPVSVPGFGATNVDLTFSPLTPGVFTNEVVFTSDGGVSTNLVTGASNKITPDVTTWPTANAITYGQTLADSTLSGGAASVAGTFTFTTPATAPGAGTASQSVTFTPDDLDTYNVVTGSVNVTVNKADPDVTTWPTASAITYGQTLADSTLSGGVATPAGSFAFTTPSTAPNAGTASQSVTFTPTDTANYNTVVGSTSVTVNKADSSVTTWPTASAITYGQTLAASTLSGGAATPAGSFAFTTPSTAPNAGTASQSVTFTPTDTDNYNPVVGSVSVTVNKADPVVTTWPTASPITSGQTLTDSTLSGGAATPTGSFAFTTPSTTPGEGTSSQSVTFTPTDTDNYNTVVGSVNVTVNAASLTAVDDFYTMAEDDTLDVPASGVLSNDVGSALSAIKVSDPAHGTVTLNSNGAFTYVPDDNFNGTDLFTYRAISGNLTSSVATVTINVTSVNGAGDIDLLNGNASFSKNWTTSNRDRFSIRGRINPRGARTDLSGSTVLIAVNGVDLATPVTLDAAGKGKAKIGKTTISVYLSSKNGKYRYKISNTDLTSALDLPDANQSSLTDLDVVLTVTGSDLDIPVVGGTFETPYTSGSGKNTKGKFKFKKNLTLTGVFNSNKTVAKLAKTGGYTVSFNGSIENENGGSPVPTDTIRIQVGGDVINAPVALVTSNMKVPGLKNFKLVPGSYKFSFTTTPLAATGLPLPGNGADTSYRLPMMITFPTGSTTNVFETIIELKRTTGTATSWKR